MAQVNAGRLTQMYDAYRSALLNKKYYGCQLEFYRKLNRTVDNTICSIAAKLLNCQASWRVLYPLGDVRRSSNHRPSPSHVWRTTMRYEIDDLRSAGLDPSGKNCRMPSGGSP